MLAFLHVRVALNNELRNILYHKLLTLCNDYEYVYHFLQSIKLVEQSETKNRN